MFSFLFQDSLLTYLKFFFLVDEYITILHTINTTATGGQVAQGAKSLMPRVFIYYRIDDTYIYIYRWDSARNSSVLAMELRLSELH